MKGKLLSYFPQSSIQNFLDFLIDWEMFVLNWSFVVSLDNCLLKSHIKKFSSNQTKLNFMLNLIMNEMSWRKLSFSASHKHRKSGWNAEHCENIQRKTLQEKECSRHKLVYFASSCRCASEFEFNICFVHTINIVRTCPDDSFLWATDRYQDIQLKIHFWWANIIMLM